MAGKYYAVRAGRKPGIYTTWGEAEKQIKGYSGAKYKSFKTRDEALAFMGNGTSTAKSADSLNEGLVAFVDGSFNKKTRTYGSGVAMLLDGKLVAEISEGGQDPRYQDSFQIAGEVFACLKAIKWAGQNGYKEIVICYDYMGIENWAKKDWKTNKPISQDYVKFFDQLQAAGMQVHFVKVKAHSNDKWNDKADELAKKAVGL